MVPANELCCSGVIGKDEFSQQAINLIENASGKKMQNSAMSQGWVDPDISQFRLRFSDEPLLVRSPGRGGKL